LESHEPFAVLGGGKAPAVTHPDA